ncbi:hypothetical protein [Actinomadura barringtoniae]|uniref:hypothetical protein n=1 Tax=Actinomadura barringtoniae TaxID=1427535 RepID=UPI00244174A5|nr:hypothetical protein [Actinomadura barringtoniae]
MRLRLCPRGQEVPGPGDQLVHQTQLLGPPGGEARAGQRDVLQRRGDAEHAHGADDAASAGQQAERDLGQPELDRGVVDVQPWAGGRFESTLVSEADGAESRERGFFLQTVEPERFTYLDVATAIVSTGHPHRSRQ